jgi:molybdate transport system substrate-binding protein
MKPNLQRTSALITFLLLFVAALSLNCSRVAPNAEKASEIDVAAASNLTDAFTELGKQFTAETGVRVVFSFGATADLTKQIENGAPFDVFASADVEHVDKLNSQGLVTAGTNKSFARGRLVLWVPGDSPLTLTRVEDVTRADVERIAIAKPDLAPYGRATVEALRALNLWAAVEPKVVYGQNVSQTKQYVATGNAEVGFIPMSLVKPGEGRSIEVDEKLHQPIVQAIAVVKESPYQDNARRFVDFVLSEKGQALLERFGYRK